MRRRYEVRHYRLWDEGDTARFIDASGAAGTSTDTANNEPGMTRPGSASIGR